MDFLYRAETSNAYSLDWKSILQDPMEALLFHYAASDPILAPSLPRQLLTFTPSPLYHPDALANQWDAHASSYTESHTVDCSSHSDGFYTSPTLYDSDSSTAPIPLVGLCKSHHGPRPQRAHPPPINYNSRPIVSPQGTS